MTLNDARRWISGIADAAGVTVLFVFAGLSLLGGSRFFHDESWWLGIAGTVICWLHPGARRNVPLALVGLTVVGMLSAALNFHPTSSAPQSWFDAARHLVAMLLLVYASAHLLRTPMRLALMATLMLAAVSIMGAQILFDRARTDFVYERVGSSSIPLVAQWGSLHQTGMLFAIAVPFPLAVALGSRSRGLAAAGIVLTAGLFAFGFVNGSRTGVLAMAVAAVAIVLMSLRPGLRRQRRSLALATAALGVAAVIVWAIFANKTSMPIVKSMTGDRLPIWTAAAHIALDHPVIGVGPGRYTETVVWKGYAHAHFPWYPHLGGGIDQAHNLVLHTAAETGILGAIFLLATWWTAVAACWRAWSAAVMPVLALGYGGALLTFFVRAQADNFLDNLVTTDRTRVVVSLLLGAALAIQRLTRAEMTE